MPVLIAEPLPMSDEQRWELGMMARASSLPASQGGAGQGVVVGRGWGRD